MAGFGKVDAATAAPAAIAPDPIKNLRRDMLYSSR